MNQINELKELIAHDNYGAGILELYCIIRGVTTIEAREATASSLLCLDHC